MTLAMGPLIILFELSILLARWLERISPPGRSRWSDDEDDDDDDYDPFAGDELDEALADSDLTKLEGPDRKD